MIREQNVRTNIKNKKDPVKKQKLLAEIWTTYRWIIEYLLETPTAWELENNNRNEQYKKRIGDWNNKTRIEKIEHIKEITNNEQQEVDVQNEKQKHQENSEVPNNVIWKPRQETTIEEDKKMMEDIVIQLIEQTIIQSNNKQQTKQEADHIAGKITKNNMITNNSKSNKQQKFNNFFCTEQQQETKPQNMTRNKELITTPKLKLEQQTTTKASPMPKTTKKNTKINNNKKKSKKEIKESKIEEENKKLRGYWTALAKIQKTKGENSSTSLESLHTTKIQENKSENLILDDSPKPAPKTMTSRDQPSLCSTSSSRKSLPGNRSNPSISKVKLLEQPKPNIDVEGFVRLPD